VGAAGGRLQEIDGLARAVSPRRRRHAERKRPRWMPRGWLFELPFQLPSPTRMRLLTSLVGIR
jgi:hypothetical protein